MALHARLTREIRSGPSGPEVGALHVAMQTRVPIVPVAVLEG
jgi:hypothetical protein